MVLTSASQEVRTERRYFLTALHNFVVRRGDNEFSARLLISQETRHVKISERSQQAQHLVTFELSRGNVHRRIRLCFTDFVLDGFKERTGSWLLKNEALLKQVFAHMFSKTEPDVPEIVVGQMDLESF